MSNYNPRISSLSPQIWFKFDDASGTPTNSGLSTSCAISTTSGSPTLNQIGLINKSVLFDGNDGYRLDTGSLNSNVFADGTFSIEAWVKTSSSSGIQEIFQMDVSTNSNATFDAGWALRLNAGKPQFYYIGKASTTFTELTHGSTISDGNWHHLVGTVKTTSTNYEIKLYLDGTLIQSDLTNSTTAPGANADGTSYARKRLGYSLNNDEYFIGNIEEFAIYSTELTATNVLDTYNVGSYKFGKGYDNWISTTQSTSNAWQYHYTNNTRTTATLLPSYSTSGNELVGNEPQWDNNQNFLSNYPYVQRVTAPNTNTPSGEFRNSFNSTPNLLMHPSDLNPNQYSAIAWKNTTGASVTVSGTVTLKLANPTNNFDGIDWWFQRELVNGSNYSLLSNGNIDNGVSSTSTYNFSNVTVASGDRLFLIVGNYEYYNYDATIVTFEVNRVAIVAADPSTASALMVQPVFSNTANVDYAASPSTASALLVDPVVTIIKSINYSADPCTASALMSTVYSGPSIVDSIVFIGNGRSFNSAITGSTSSISLGYNADGTERKFVFNLGSLTTGNNILKLKFKSTLTVDTTNLRESAPTFNIYSLDNAADAGDWTVGNTNVFPTAKTFLYKTRMTDDGSATGYYLDLTPAIASIGSSDVNSKYFYIEPNWSFTGSTLDYITYINTGIYSELFDALVRQTSVSTSVTADPMSVTTSVFVDPSIATTKQINISADPSTASALFVYPSTDIQRYVNAAAAVTTASEDMPMPVISAQRNLNYSAEPATASATTVTPVASITLNVTISANGSTATALAVHPTFLRTTNYPASAATASATAVHPLAVNAIVPNSMNASALFVNPLVSLPESVDAMTTTASATMVQPTLTSQLLGAYTAQPMTASTDIINPPAYTNLFADKWYNALFTQHSRLHGVRIPLSNETGEAILKRFDDVVVPKLIGSTVTNNLTNKIVYDNIIDDTGAAPALIVRGEFNPSANPASIQPGFFDTYGRKAVRFNNITTGYENSLSFTPEFTFEMSIKTTKADQIISHGRWKATNGNQTRASVLGISDGKLFVNTTQVIGPPPLSHYKELADPNKQYAIIGNKSIADGEWHHIVVQYGFGDSRLQFWIDGKLDIQRFSDRVEGLNFLGHNASISTYASDFYTSAWSYDANAFILEQDVSDHNFAYTNIEPVRAEPMIASALNPGGGASGNRPRALMLYFWPTSLNQNQNLITRNFVDNTFDQNLETMDYINQPPQQYYGWDVFPVDVTGYYVSDLVKEEAYGGSRNIFEQTFSFAETSPVNQKRPKFKVNRAGYFRNTLTDTARYINLTEDIDLSQFDAIFFKNYPDESIELDSYARNEVVDAYFGLRETVIFENFLKSLRDAVDTGISLMVTNPQLALDLKIVDRIEVVPSLEDTGYYYSDPYTASIAPAVYEIGTETQTANLWNDTFKNNRTRLINTYPGITDEACIILVRAAVWNNDDGLAYGDPDRVFMGYDIKPNGLSVGDEWFFATYDPTDQRGGFNNDLSSYLATPIANVKAGTPITAFANQYRKGLDLVDNPYKNYVTSIAIAPGDVLDGRQVGGKIWVNFTDYINRENEYATIDAIHANFINLAYQKGDIDLATRDLYLASSDLQPPAVGELTSATTNKASFWHSNGANVLKQGKLVENADGQSDFTGNRPRPTSIRKARKVSNFIADKNSVMGGASAGSVTATSNFGQFFTFTFSNKYEQLFFEVMSMNTRGFKWISLRQPAVTQTQTHTATTANATMVQPVVTPGKQVTVVAQVMLSNAEKVSAVGFAGNDRRVVTLPLEATARITEPSKVVIASPMTSSVLFPSNYAITTTASDQVVVYVLHEDPILYLREDIIK
jgi:hypothetical protein